MDGRTQGLVHLYCGEGKGKTTAAMGLALRALGNGRKVTIVQFLKGSPSGEVALLEQLGARLYRGDPGTKFAFQMTRAEQQAVRTLQTQQLRAALADPPDLLVLDEGCAAWQLDLVDRPLLREAVLHRPAAQEVVLTGRDPAEWMVEAADYYTEMVCHKHPYQAGIPARKGIEF